MAQTAPPTQKPPPTTPQPQSGGSRLPNHIDLPEDSGVHLYVAAMAAVMVMYNKFTKTEYELEVANQEINSLTRITRDLATAVVRGIAALKRKYGPISDIPTENILRRPPNWSIVVTSFLAVAVLVAYGQYNPQFAAQAVAVWAAYQGYIVASALGLIMFFLAVKYGGLGRRKRR